MQSNRTSAGIALLRSMKRVKRVRKQKRRLDEAVYSLSFLQGEAASIDSKRYVAALTCSLQVFGKEPASRDLRVDCANNRQGRLNGKSTGEIRRPERHARSASGGRA